MIRLDRKNSQSWIVFFPSSADTVLAHRIINAVASKVLSTLTPFVGSLSMAVGAHYVALSHFFHDFFDARTFHPTTYGELFLVTNVIEVHHVGWIRASTIYAGISFLVV